jgi:hypothetical protein
MRKSLKLPAAAAALFAAALVAATTLTVTLGDGPEETAADPRTRFDRLSQNGNSNCSAAFTRSVALMPADARLQGSCCSEMDFHRYGEQIEGLKAFAAIAAIPPDPYDIPAPLAAQLMRYYDLQLTPAEQTAYEYAVQRSNERGPCCCRCWRWAVYGGLAKHLIRDYGFDGERIAQLWDLSDGCGGTSHVH